MKDIGLKNLKMTDTLQSSTLHLDISYMVEKALIYRAVNKMHELFKCKMHNRHHKKILINLFKMGHKRGEFDILL